MTKDVAATELKPKKVAPAGMTSSNKNFTIGQPLLTADELQSAGPAITALHNYYTRLSMAKKKSGIMVAFKRIHLLRSLDSEFLVVAFADLYELFHYDALDMSILRCYTLHMVKEAKAKALPVVFLDPELMSLSTITVHKSYVVDYVTKAFGKCAKKQCIMFAHNPGGHWILVAIVPKWNKVLYFDSLRSRPCNHNLLKEALDEAFLSYTTTYGMVSKKLAHVTKFPCHQQRPGNECGFYTAHHMMLALGLLDVDKPEDLEVVTTPLGEDVLDNIREDIASFIMSEVIDKKGEFHCQRPGQV
ncbi:hypothetical protein EJB05_10148, partial [Eragrostis curvula]